MKLSLFSVSYAGYWGQQKLDLADFIAKAAQLGYESVMLAGKRPHLSPLDTDSDCIASVKAALSQNNIACGVIGGYTDLSPTAAAEVPYLEMQISYVESLARIASELGAAGSPGISLLTRPKGTALQTVLERGRAGAPRNV